MALCPAHPDKKPSLSITYKPNNNCLLVNCFAGCATNDVLNKVGLSSPDLRDVHFDKDSSKLKVMKHCNTPRKQTVIIRNKAFQAKKTLTNLRLSILHF